MAYRNHFQILFVINFIVTLGFGISDTFFSVYVFELGGRGVLLALPLISYSVAKAVFSPFMGRCSDTFGAEKIMLVSLTLYLLVSVLYLVSTNLFILAISRLLQGVACAMFRPVIVSLVSESAIKEKRSSVMGTFDISFYAALSFGPVVGGYMKDQLGFPAIFLNLMLLSILAILICGCCVRDSSPRVVATHSKRNKQSSLIQPIIRSRNLRGLLAFIFGRASCISLTGAFLPIILTEELKLSGTQTGIVMASSCLTITLLLRPMGMLADRVSHALLIILGGISVSIIYLIIPATVTFNQMIFATILLGSFSALSQPACTAMLIEEGMHYGTGNTVGIFNGAMNLGFIFGPIFGAFILSVFGIDAVFYAAGGIGVSTILLFTVNTHPSLFSPVDDRCKN
ncbi:MFS transporter [Shewanella atlantica]|uniref:MFS transporter n=1 Tax=Shewanella atlantica TaxID=271099 RepID=A0A431W1J9_9GAMM|nr:MFS transporter [Shewanella atlantica]RTR29352.1 MFS transporter [Shewanella atlantica]